MGSGWAGGEAAAAASASPPRAAARPSRMVIGSPPAAPAVSRSSQGSSGGSAAASWRHAAAERRATDGGGRRNCSAAASRKSAGRTVSRGSRSGRPSGSSIVRCAPAGQSIATSRAWTCAARLPWQSWQGKRTPVPREVLQVLEQVRLHQGPHLGHRLAAGQLARRGVAAALGLRSWRGGQAVSMWFPQREVCRHVWQQQLRQQGQRVQRSTGCLTGARGAPGSLLPTPPARPARAAPGQTARPGSAAAPPSAPPAAPRHQRRPPRPPRPPQRRCRRRR